MQNILNIILIAISVALIVTILLQQRNAGGSSLFGGGGDSSYYSKRGFEKILFRASIVLAALFVIINFINLLI